MLSTLISFARFAFHRARYSWLQKVRGAHDVFASNSAFNVRLEGLAETWYLDLLDSRDAWEHAAARRRRPSRAAMVFWRRLERVFPRSGWVRHRADSAVGLYLSRMR